MMTVGGFWYQWCWMVVVVCGGFMSCMCACEITCSLCDCTVPINKVLCVVSACRASLGFLTRGRAQCGTLQEFEHSWHVVLNLKPPESSSVCDAFAERGKSPRVAVIPGMLHGRLTHIVVWRSWVTTRLLSTGWMVFGRSRAMSMLFPCVVWWTNLCSGTWMVHHLGREFTRLIGVGISSVSRTKVRIRWWTMKILDLERSGKRLISTKNCTKHVTLFCLSMGPEGEMVWVLQLGYGGFAMNMNLLRKVSYGGRVLRNASAMTAEREVLRMDIEHLTVFFPTDVSSFDYQVENSGRCSTNLMRSLCVSSVFAVVWMTRIALVRIISKTNKQQHLESHESIPGFTKRSCAIECTSCTAESHQKTWSKDWNSKLWDSGCSKDLQTRFTEQLGRSESQFHSRCLCWCRCCYIDIICQQNHGISYQSPTTSWERPREVSTERKYNAESRFNIGCSSECTTGVNHKKTPVAAHNSSIPTSGDSPWFWITNKERNWGNSYWQNGFNQDNSQASVAKSLVPNAGMLWIGEIEDPESIDELITAASITSRPILDFENLDFKVGSGLRKTSTGNFKKRVSTAEGKAELEKRSVTGRQIYDFFKNSGDNEAILDIRDSSNFQLKNDNVQAFETWWDEVLSAVTDRLTDSILESLCQMQVEK